LSSKKEKAMATRVALLLLAMAGVSTGCHRASDSAVSPAGSGVPAVIDDYRKLALGELRALLREKLGSHGITIEADGANHYKGAIPSPEGTVMLPLEVTVEAQRIVCVTRTPAGSTQNIITPQGLKTDLQMK
jgi:hypothetical protein